jgi:hypothetical protein
MPETRPVVALRNPAGTLKFVEEISTILLFAPPVLVTEIRLKLFVDPVPLTV